MSSTLKPAQTEESHNHPLKNETSKKRKAPGEVARKKSKPSDGLQEFLREGVRFRERMTKHIEDLSLITHEEQGNQFREDMAETLQLFETLLNKAEPPKTQTTGSRANASSSGRVPTGSRRQPLPKLSSSMSMLDIGRPPDIPVLNPTSLEPMTMSDDRFTRITQLLDREEEPLKGVNLRWVARVLEREFKPFKQQVLARANIQSAKKDLMLRLTESLKDVSTASFPERENAHALRFKVLGPRVEFCYRHPLPAKKEDSAPDRDEKIILPSIEESGLPGIEESASSRVHERDSVGISESVSPGRYESFSPERYESISPERYESISPGLGPQSPGGGEKIILPGSEKLVLPGCEKFVLPSRREQDILPGRCEQDILPGRREQDILPSRREKDILPGRREEDTLSEILLDDDLIDAIPDHVVDSVEDPGFFFDQVFSDERFTSDRKMGDRWDIPGLDQRTTSDTKMRYKWDTPDFDCSTSEEGRR
jgi:hypothetical protein